MLLWLAPGALKTLRLRRIKQFRALVLRFAKNHRKYAAMLPRKIGPNVAWALISFSMWASHPDGVGNGYPKKPTMNVRRHFGLGNSPLKSGIRPYKRPRGQLVDSPESGWAQEGTPLHFGLQTAWKVCTGGLVITSVGLRSAKFLPTPSCRFGDAKVAPDGLNRGTLQGLGSNHGCASFEAGRRNLG
jgi:hypothetical protein